MSSTSTPIAAADTPPTPPPSRPAPTAGRDRRPPAARRLGSLVLAAVGIAGLGVAAWIFQAQLQSAAQRLAARVRSVGHPEAPHAAARPARLGPTARLKDGMIVLPERSRAAMGVSTVPVQAQTDPIRLELLGTTEYITDTLTEIRPMFKGRVDKVHVAVNQPVKRGDPLVDLYSKELAEAKSAYEIERIQWIHDRKLFEQREQLIKSNSIASILFEETRNNEMKSHKEYEVARDKLLVYGLTDADVEKVDAETGAEKARLTLRSPADGFVIGRNVVPGNLYDENDTLLTVAPLDRLWVWGNVFESDLDLVRMGQSWEIGFPFLVEKLAGKVEYISNRVDPNTHAVRVRTSIPNAQGRLKSDMLVRGILAIDPIPGRTVVPRTSLVVDGGHSFVFVRAAGHADQFERRLVDVAQEKDDHAVIAKGIAAGEEVVAVGGLLLAQVYDDLKLVASGAPAGPVGEGVD